MMEPKLVLYNNEEDVNGSFNRVGEIKALGVSNNAVIALESTAGLSTESKDAGVKPLENAETLPFTELGNSSVQPTGVDQVVAPTSDMLKSVNPEPTVENMSQEPLQTASFENPMASVMAEAQNFMNSPESSSTFTPVSEVSNEPSNNAIESEMSTVVPTMPLFENSQPQTNSNVQSVYPESSPVQATIGPTITQTGEIVRDSVSNVTNEDLLNQGIPVFTPPVAPKSDETMNEPEKDFGSTLENVLPMNNEVETQKSLVEEPVQAQETLNTEVSEPTYVSPVEPAPIIENVSKPVLNSEVKEKDNSSKIDSLIEAADRIIEEMNNFRNNLKELKEANKTKPVINSEMTQAPTVVDSISQPVIPQVEPVENVQQEQAAPVFPFVQEKNLTDMNQLFGRTAA